MTKTLGRERELAHARERLATAATGSLLFVGPPGIGKSTVLDEAACAAEELGYDVRRTRGAASESDLPYVGLIDLVGTAVQEDSVPLPDPLRRALDVVLLRADAPEGGADLLAVHLGVLEVLRTRAKDQRLALVLDDVQWLDEPSRHVLQFVLPRLPREAVAVLAAAREAGPELEALLLPPTEHVEIGALSVDEIADLVASRTAQVPSRQRAAALHRLSEGNPFLALELARGQAPDLSGIDQFTVPERYARVLAARLSVLSPGPRQTVLAASLVARPTTGVLVKVSGPEGLGRAESSGVLRVRGADVEFDHPLFAAACRREAGPLAQRQMHLRLASLVDNDVERARHLALGTQGVDGVVADQVEAAARAAADRTAIATAAELARAAVTLTPPEALADRVRRATLAAQWFCQVGEWGQARAIVEPLLEQVPPGPLRARCLVAAADAQGQEVADALTVLREAIDQPGVEPEVLVRALVNRAAAMLASGNLESARAAAAEAAARADQAGLTTLSTSASSMEADVGLALGQSLTTSPAWSRAKRWTAGASAYEHPSRSLAFEASWGDDQHRAAALLAEVVEVAHAAVDLGTEGYLLLHSAEVAIRDGRLNDAAVWAERAYHAVADGTHDQAVRYIRAHVAAWTGDLDTARELATGGLTMAKAAWDVIFEAQLLLVLGFTEVSAGRFEEASAHASRLRDSMARMAWGHPGTFRWQGDAVEAFLGTGRVDEALDVTSRLWAQADRLDLLGSQGLAARCDGLIQAHTGDLKLAEDRLAQSLALMTGLDMPLERARTLLALGVVRRRRRQKAGAREALEQAHRIFEQSGARGWARRVGAELARATGVHAGAELSVGERNVAELAARGRTNREIGAQLYLSPKTVETVLTRVYRKLGVRSRTELARSLGVE